MNIVGEIQNKVLVVDDVPTNVEILREMLNHNYQVKAATSGEEALEISRRFRPDIILLDIVMPGMDGVRLAGIIRKA